MNDQLPARRRPYPWQEQIWQQLLRAVHRERLAHAVLITGTTGTGRGAFADAAARHLLCSAPEADGNCGRCKSCTLAQQGAHADLFTLSPAAAGKKIGVDAIRDALAFMATTSALGPRKVILVRALDALTHSAFNAFLKGLEEPSDNSFLLLVAARGQYLPATIRSRCQALPLPEPQPEEARCALQGAARDPQQLEAALALLPFMPGQPLAALQLAADGLAEALLALHAGLASTEGGDDGALRAAAAIPEYLLLRALQWQLRERAAQAARCGDRQTLKGSLRASDQVFELDQALRSGSNPNADLLRSSALRAWHRIGAVAGSATLPAKSRMESE